MKPSPRSASQVARTWLEEEVPLGRSFRTQGGRLLRRGRASWFLWVPLALVIGAGMARSSARHTAYFAEVVLRATAGRPETAADSDAGLGRLRSYVRDWVFTGDHLLEVMARHRREFPGAATRPSEAIESMRGATEVTIVSSDFIEDRASDDPRPSARITVTYAAATPELALTMARELATLVVSSALHRENEIAEHAEAAAATALKQSETSLEAALQTGANAPADLALGSLRAAVAASTAARLANPAGEENGMLRFNVVDWGQPPPLRSKALFAEEMIVMFSVALFVSWLLAGAFDPRILDRTDLTDTGLTVLGQVPRLPGSRAGKPGGKPSQSPTPIL